MIYPWQQTQWQQIEQLIKSGRLPHAILLTGNQGLGKSDFAKALASAVLCRQPAADSKACGQCQMCQLLAAATHPDYYYIKPTASENSKSKNPVINIRIDDIRTLCSKLNQTSQYSGYRVAILDQAEQLTISAANSLLKTLEEPGQNVLILLVSARPHRLPVTIRSRCQLLRFNEPDEEQALDWLKQQRSDVNQDHLLQALNYAHGAPLAALQHLQATEHYELLADAMTAGLMGKSSLDYALKLTNYSKTQTLESMLIWVSDLGRLLTCGPGVKIINERYRDRLQARAKTVNQHRLFQFHDQLNFSLMHSSIAVNEQLLWENLLLSWDNL
jgi:DNA polymerase-3 subunit delta'